MRLLILFALVVLFCSSNAWADCKSDCQQDYFNAMEECKTTYSNPTDPECAEKCQECLEQAKSDYGACLDQCTDDWDTHED